MNKFTKVLLATLFIASASSSLSALPGSLRHSNEPCAHGFDVTSFKGVMFIASWASTALAWKTFKAGDRQAGAIFALGALISYALANE